MNLVFDNYQICAHFEDDDTALTGLTKSTGPHCFGFEVIGVNHEPCFKEKFENLEVKVGETKTIFFPKIRDEDEKDVHFLSVEF